MYLSLRAYSPRAAVLVNGYIEGMTEFVSENINTGKNIAELSFAITVHHYHSWLSLSQTQSV